MKACYVSARPGRRWVSLALLFLCVGAGYLLAAFGNIPEPAKAVQQYYDRKADSLLLQLDSFRQAAGAAKPVAMLRQHFYRCRIGYKRIELFADVFDRNKARLLNGPDLLRIDEENPSDSMVQHGFQVMERMLFSAPADTAGLAAEVHIAFTNVQQLRSDPDRVYYFTDKKIWHAMRLAVYRLVSLGVTGFDVPLSGHILPEVAAVVQTVQEVAGAYKTVIGSQTYDAGKLACRDALAAVAQARDADHFDRLSFTRQNANRISQWLTRCCRTHGWLLTGERLPLNEQAGDLFSGDVINVAFFSPNGSYTVTPQRVALGRRLFYDPILSGDGKRSCASCHQPQRAFTDGLARPMDVSGSRMLPRNTPTLWNAALQAAQFYDSRTDKLENQLSAVVHNKDEMNGSLAESITRLLRDSAYVRLFVAAYPAAAAPVTEYNIANAISSYVRTLVSLNSRFDRYMRRQTDSFSQAEKKGYNLFMGKAKCGTCHYAPLFNGLVPPLYEESESEILAVPAGTEVGAGIDADEGRCLITHQPLHRYAFKTPTVRNAALTAPYMHNGVFANLTQVLDFYNKGGGAGAGIALETQTLPPTPLELTAGEIKDIIAFIQTLTDTAYIAPRR